MSAEAVQRLQKELDGAVDALGRVCEDLDHLTACILDVVAEAEELAEEVGVDG